MQGRAVEGRRLTVREVDNVADPLASADWNAAEEVDHITERVRAVFVTAQNPGIIGTLPQVLLREQEGEVWYIHRRIGH